MPLFLSKRQPQLIEEMDRPDCDPLLLENTYRQFATINRLLSQWKKIYRLQLKPFLGKDREYTLLDIGFGGGDIPIQLVQWANKDGFRLRITAIETDQRALDYIQKVQAPDHIEFVHTSSSELVEKGHTFDFVISNHLIHHLGQNQLEKLCHEAEQLCEKRILFNDIHRSDWAYLLFLIFSSLIFRRSFITKDGLISIRKSYTSSELKALVPNHWEIRKVFPFRVLMTHESK